MTCDSWIEGVMLFADLFCTQTMDMLRRRVLIANVECQVDNVLVILSTVKLAGVLQRVSCLHFTVLV